MRNPFIIFSILLNLLLFGYIIYQNNNDQNNLVINYDDFPNLDGVTDENSLNELLTSYNEVIGGITSSDSLNTKPIGLDEANRLHAYMIKSRDNIDKDSTRAVRFSAPVLFASLYDSTSGASNRPAAFLKLLQDLELVCYLGKYDTNKDINGDGIADNTIDQSTIIIQLGNDNGVLYPNMTFNMGNLCPTNCLKVETIVKP